MKRNNPCIYDTNTFVAFDTNVWLDLYTYPPEVTKEICDALKRIKHKIILPDQVYFEFNNNKDNKRNTALSCFDVLSSKHLQEISRKKDALLRDLGGLASNGFFDTCVLSQEIEKQFQTLSGELKKSLRSISHDYKKQAKIFENDSSDPVSVIIKEVRSYGLTQELSMKELVAIFEEGEIRYKYGLAPGVTDTEKGLTDISSTRDTIFFVTRKKYGDLIIWKELLSFAKGKNINLIFVENERKTDWWGNRKEYRPANVLIEEYREVSDSGNFFMVDFATFLQEYQLELELAASDATELVKRLKYREHVFTWLQTYAKQLLTDVLAQQLDDEDEIYELIKDLPVDLGYIEGIVEYEINDIGVRDVFVERDPMSGKNVIEGEVSLSLSANVSTYISHDFSVGQEYEFEITFHTSSFFEIDYSCLETEGEPELEFSHCSYINEQLVSKALVRYEFWDSED